MSERTKIFESDTVNPNDYKEETVNELAEYKQYEEDMQSQIKTDLEELAVVESFPNRVEGRQMVMMMAPVAKK